MQASLSGGAPTRIVDTGTDHRGGDWSVDGHIYYSPTAGSGIWRVSADGETPEAVTVPNLEAREKSHRHPVVLPGGRAILFTLGTGDIRSWDDGSIAVLTPDDGQYRVLLEGG